MVTIPKLWPLHLPKAGAYKVVVVPQDNYYRIRLISLDETETVVSLLFDKNDLANKFILSKDNPVDWLKKRFYDDFKGRWGDHIYIEPV